MAITIIPKEAGGRVRDEMTRGKRIYELVGDR
jgi:hypothetical protein